VTYDPYGKPTFESPANQPLTDAAGSPVAQSPGGNPRLFAGMRYDPETGSRSANPAADRGGLYQTWQRMLNPNDGRFLTRDPLGAWGDPESGGNAYAYAAGNPINATDPTGMAYFNPKEITIDKPVPWSVHYNPKEIGLDKSVPWQKAKNSHANVLFNPKEYEITKATPWKRHDIQGLDAPSQEFTQPYSQQHELFFDMFETSIQMKRAAYCGSSSLALQEATQMESRRYLSLQEAIQTENRPYQTLLSSGAKTASIQMKRAAYCGAPSISLFNASLRNIPLIGSVSVGFTIMQIAIHPDYGDIVVECRGQRSNPTIMSIAIHPQYGDIIVE
jgi:RHS repeat-associated protein